ncbi:hypothetical protein AMS68_004491 [Peltaster fructicola]|uniref:WH1 domain-containing protein n=1 Tax=Peltaster fructicola TaxID=286661 RepID=A0A6H0XW74_9PEZI|nr:hypothetical protein AMS68_004491 [Peltaster fructicola]
MPSKRRSAQPQPAILSDYDTDPPAPAPASLPTPQWTLDSLNEEVLRMYLPDLDYISKVAPFTVIYQFSPESQHWEKNGCEGTLFLCKMPGARYTVVVLNRKSLDNFVMELTSADDVEITNEYVILQSTNDSGVPTIYGLWIFNDDGKSPSTKDILGMAIQDAAMKAQLAIEAANAPLYDEHVQQSNEQAAPNLPTQPAQIHQTYGQVSHEPRAQPGQPLDINKLFSKPQIQQEVHTAPMMDNAGVNGQQLDLLKLFGNGQSRQQHSAATLFPA